MFPPGFNDCGTAHAKAHVAADRSRTTAHARVRERERERERTGELGQQMHKEASYRPDIPSSHALAGDMNARHLRLTAAQEHITPGHIGERVGGVPVRGCDGGCKRGANCRECNHPLPTNRSCRDGSDGLRFSRNCDRNLDGERER